MILHFENESTSIYNVVTRAHCELWVAWESFCVRDEEKKRKEREREREIDSISITLENVRLQVLCELQVALVERQLSSRPDVTRDIMKSDFRKVSSSETFRNLRDWLIFRDYMNGLEYVVQVFEHLRRGLQSWGWQGGSRRRATRRRLAHLRKPDQPYLDGHLSS